MKPTKYNIINSQTHGHIPKIMACRLDDGVDGMGVGIYFSAKCSGSWSDMDTWPRPISTLCSTVHIRTRTRAVDVCVHKLFYLGGRKSIGAQRPPHPHPQPYRFICIINICGLKFAMYFLAPGVEWAKD